MKSLEASDPHLTVAIDSLMGELSQLASISEADPPIVTRVVFTEADMRGRKYVKELCAASGLSIREDAIGNTFARWQGSEPELAPVATGSHIDAIPNAGAYDGTVGVLGGLEAIRTLQRAGLRPRRSIELIIFTSEEPTRFGIGCLGSRLMGGVLSPGQASAFGDKHGRSLEDVRHSAGFNGDLESVRIEPGRYAAFVELHIEQGPILERESIDLGIVSHIAAPASLRVVIEGEGGHAGALLMPDRHDALVAAAELIVSLEAAAKSTGAIDTVATIGICDVFPSAVNSVPSLVRLEVDVRDTDQARRDRLLEEWNSFGADVAARRGVLITFESVNSDPPATCAPEILLSLEASATAAGFTSKRMISRAYHDALFMARVAPVGMIFIPSRNGVSHRPDEYSAPASISAGVETLARSLASLSS